jgi:hypothetical protein
MAVRTITHAEFVAELKAQGVPREDYAVKCCICGTVQSINSMLKAGVSVDDANKAIGFSCIGRFTGAGPAKQGDKPGKGCDWSLGGLFRLHTVEVLFDGDKSSPAFEPVSAAEAQALKSQLEGE